jgi:branched-subunit amino acid ABC-type transport system permease component
MGLLIVLIAAMAFGGGLSAMVGRAAFEPFRGRARRAPLMATLGLSFVLYQVALLWRDTFPIDAHCGRLSFCSSKCLFLGFFKRTKVK